MTSLFQCSVITRMLQSMLGISHKKASQSELWRSASCEWGQRPVVCVTHAISSIHWRLLTLQIMVSAPLISDHNKKLHAFMFRSSFLFSCGAVIAKSWSHSVTVHNGKVVLDHGAFRSSFTTFVCGTTSVFVQSWSHFIDGRSELIILIDEVPDGDVSHHELVQLPHEPLALFTQQLLLFLLLLLLLMNRKTVFTWLVTTRDSSWPISDSCCSFRTETRK